MASRPEGEPKPSDFNLIELPVPNPNAGEILIRTLFQSLDPYMRGRMRYGPSYATPLEPGDIITGEIVGRVEESNSDYFHEGDIVRSNIGWQEWSSIPAHKASRVDTSLGPISTALGVLGMPGLTAYHGLLEICHPKAGETLVVSAASGAVGAIVGQIGKINGCTVIGIAGSDRKCNYVVKELDFDASINYKNNNVESELEKLAPNGINVYFDNVGGPISDAVFNNLAHGARIAICGQIALYNAIDPPQGPRNLSIILRTQSKVEGFLVYQFEREHDIARAQLAKWIKEGRLQYREDIIEGFENAPSAFIGLLRGDNFGKLLIKVSD